MQIIRGGHVFFFAIVPVPLCGVRVHGPKLSLPRALARCVLSCLDVMLRRVDRRRRGVASCHISFCVLWPFSFHNSQIAVVECRVRSSLSPMMCAYVRLWSLYCFAGCYESSRRRPLHPYALLMYIYTAVLNHALDIRFTSISKTHMITGQFPYSPYKSPLNSKLCDRCIGTVSLPDVGLELSI